MFIKVCKKCGYRAYYVGGTCPMCYGKMKEEKKLQTNRDKD